jgi:hypothetical protein
MYGREKMNKRRKTIQVLVTMSVAVVMMAAMALPALAQQGPEVRVTHSVSFAGQQDIAVDSNGNVHIAYTDFVVGNASWEIFYTMLDNNGNTLIDDTMISDHDDENSMQPAIGVDSNGKVHIVWCDKIWGDSPWVLAYTKLDPYTDDRDGDTADESAITLIDDKQLTDPGDIIGPRMAIDSNDDIHIVWETGGFASVYYMKIDNNGNELVAETTVSEAWHAFPSIAVDSNDNLHITWDQSIEENFDAGHGMFEGSDGSPVGNGGPTFEIYYKMIKGSDGSTLIDTTRITPDDNKRSKRPSVTADFQDKIHIVWQDMRGLTTEIYHSKLDPYTDDRDGDAADESAITLIDDTPLTPDDGVKSNSPMSAIQCGRYIHITWNEEHEGEAGPAYLYYMIVDTDVNYILAATSLITEKTFVRDSPWTMAHLDIERGGKAHITWCDDRDSGYLGNVYYTNYQGPSCPAAPIGPGNCIYLHCEDGLFNLTEPVDTQWHELWPFFCRQYHLSSWNDTSGDGVLSHCDWIDMYEKPNGAVKPYHVEEVTITLNVTLVDVGERMFIELEGGYNETVLDDPVGSKWHEIYPNFCKTYNLTGRMAGGSPGLVDDLIGLQDAQTGNVTPWIVEDVAIDIVVCREPPPVGGEAYPVSKASLLAPLIAVGVVLAGGISWYVLKRRRAQS